MNKDERARIGRKLRSMRVERGLKQTAVAADARVKISLGTLQAIEGNWYAVRDASIEAYAQFFGTSLTKLLVADEPKAIAATDPLLQDLNEEHLEIARQYMRARKRIRTGIELLLTRQDEDHFAALLTKLAGLSGERLAQIDDLLSIDDRTALLIERIVQRLIADPTFAGLMESTLVAMKPKHRKPLPQKERPATKRRG